jgi:hypothetical protein
MVGTAERRLWTPPIANARMAANGDPRNNSRSRAVLFPGYVEKSSRGYVFGVFGAGIKDRGTTPDASYKIDCGKG